MVEEPSKRAAVRVTQFKCINRPSYPKINSNQSTMILVYCTEPFNTSLCKSRFMKTEEKNINKNGSWSKQAQSRGELPLLTDWINKLMKEKGAEERQKYWGVPLRLELRSPGSKPGMLPITPQGHPPTSAECSNLNASAGCLPHHWLGNMAPSLGPRELSLSATSCRVVLTRCDLCVRGTGHGSRTGSGRRAACVSLKIIIYRYELLANSWTTVLGLSECVIKFYAVTKAKNNNTQTKQQYRYSWKHCK